MVLMMNVLSVHTVRAEKPEYQCEMGLQGGLGYYVGDVTDHVFSNIREAYGAQFRYKFDMRWALQIKGQGQRIAFPEAVHLDANQLVNLDAVGEFNFFRFGAKQYDDRIKPLTPYIFLGVGMGIYTGVRDIKIGEDEEGKKITEPQADKTRAAAYIPFGLGLKWKFADRWGLQLAWQHNLYFADDLENSILYDNAYELNGSNILKNDLSSSLTIGIIFEFAKTDKVCRFCD